MEVSAHDSDTSITLYRALCDAFTPAVGGLTMTRRPKTIHYHDVTLAEGWTVTLELDLKWQAPTPATDLTPGTDWAIIDTRISNVYYGDGPLKSIHPILMDALEYYVEKLDIEREVKEDL